jgi:hypothetical protein
MKKIYALAAVLLVFPFTVNSQCNTSNATSCVCDDGTTDCNLLPDITVSWYAIESYLSGPNEFSQTGNGVNDGRLKITASTPNIGHGPLTVRGSNYFVCGNDTVVGDPGVCPDGSAPRQLIVQRIYHKNGNTMTYTDRWAGAMTYHPTHGHNHVDDWGVFTLRLMDPNEPDPRNWPIVGNGSKLGFCLMDYGTCAFYNGHCRDNNTVYNNGTTLINPDFPNYGLGGGSYGCSVVEQGISSGYTDIYSENLDGMWINIPPGTCNGLYYIVADVDPNNAFVEEDETNNYTAVPFMLTQQDAPGNPVSYIYPQGSTTLCGGQQVELKATTGFSYLWSTGDTTQSIMVDQPGTYSVTVTTYCGTAASSPITITTLAPPADPVAADTTICAGQSAVLSATGSNVAWYDGNGYQVGLGNVFTTPSLTSTTTYFAADVNVIHGDTNFVGLADTAGTSKSYGVSNQWLVFDALTDISILSVEVYANGAGTRVFQILNDGGNLVQSGSFNIPDGRSRVNVNFDVPAGTGYEFRVSGTPNLLRVNTGGTFAYPFTITDTVSITGSSAGNNYYYYFFDWEVSSSGVECASGQTPVQVTVNNCAAIDEHRLENSLSVYPNPNSGEFTISMNVPGTAPFKMAIHDNLGRVVYTEQVGSTTGLFNRNLSLSQLPAGLYSVRVEIEGQTLNKLIVVE